MGSHGISFQVEDGGAYTSEESEDEGTRRNSLYLVGPPHTMFILVRIPIVTDFAPFLLNAVIPEIIVGIAQYLEHWRTFGAPSILLSLDLGVTSRDLSMTLTV